VARNVVCISHATGSGGEDVGRLVAEQLGFLYVDEEIVAQAAAQGRIDPRDVADEERRKSLAARILDAMGESGGEAWALGGTPPPRVGDELSSADVRALIRETILQTAARGRVVIVAHAASQVVGDRTEALRVLVTASPETREQRVAAAEGLERDRAARAVKDADAARRDYLKRFYGVDRESPTHYDLVVNTDALSVEEAAAVVAHAGLR
jgi:cytidylate kinase